jgi:hypothetical protein
VRLFALLTPGIDADSLNYLDTMGLLTTNDVANIIATPGMAASLGFVSLLGDTGILIPPRGDTVFNSVVLDDAQLTTLLSEDTCGMRWQYALLPFEPVPFADALIDTDFIEIKSWLHIEGTQNMDSLIIWEE